ncbi:hypothetical protein FIBSPDRAFT_862358 [Athelia psychrophila]|uniref:Uncharacterized protein n=1 Tax=Athelia psychrophila TaxID=1759441 RepID=A0A166IIU1_9AGAM|nr:hypothetical protein FIBSPDRAFT_862358 [Fibularhizoctonia sp. CBS 109695]
MSAVSLLGVSTPPRVLHTAPPQHSVKTRWIAVPCIVIIDTWLQRPPVVHPPAPTFLTPQMLHKSQKPRWPTVYL